MDDYYSLEFPSGSVATPSSSSTPAQTTLTQPIQPIPKVTTTSASKEIIILGSVSGVVGLLTIIALALSILAYMHQPVSPFALATVSNLQEISDNVTVVDTTSIQAAGFQDTNKDFSAIGGSIECTGLTSGNIVSDSVTANTITVSTLVAPSLTIGEVKTDSVILASSQFNSSLSDSKIVYADTTSSKTNTITPSSVVLSDTSTTQSVTITPDNIVFTLNTNQIKSLESLRFMASDLTQATTTPATQATLLMPAVTPIQFGSLTIPLAQLKLGSTFRITANGTHSNSAGALRYMTICVANTQTQSGFQPAQIILGVLNRDGVYVGDGSGQWIYECTFSINIISTPATSWFQAAGKIIAQTAGSVSQNAFRNTNTSVDIQAGLQLTIWGTWDAGLAQFILNQLYVEQLF
jgi:hypothetical protein